MAGDSNFFFLAPSKPWTDWPGRARSKPYERGDECVLSAPWLMLCQEHSYHLLWQILAPFYR